MYRGLFLNFKKMAKINLLFLRFMLVRSKEKIIYFEFDDVRWELAKPFLEFYRAGGGKVSDIIHSLYESPSYVPTEFEIDGELISVSPRPLDHLPSGWKVKECTICLVFSEGDLR